MWVSLANIVNAEPNSNKKEIFVDIGETATIACPRPATANVAAKMEQMTWTVGSGDGKTVLNSTASTDRRLSFVSDTGRYKSKAQPVLGGPKYEAKLYIGIPDAILKIANVKYSDRNKYSCSYKAPVEVGNATAGYKRFVTDFQLRVRDPLGALWPAIGIVVEAVILFLIIYGTEWWKKRSDAGQEIQISLDNKTTYRSFGENDYIEAEHVSDDA